MPPTETCDVICAAIVTDNVRRHLLAVAKAALGLRGEFSVIYHLTAGNPGTLPAGLAIHDRGPLSGPAYLAAAKHARIIVDLDDGTEAAARTARLDALKQVGATVLAEDSPAARVALPRDALFTTPEALVDKVYGYLR
jgi:hypothetical protein